MIFFKNSNWDKAVSFLQESIRYEERITTFIKLGDALWNLGEMTQAFEIYKRAVQIDSNNLQANVSLFTAYEHGPGHRKKAEKGRAGLKKQIHELILRKDLNQMTAEELYFTGLYYRQIFLHNPSERMILIKALENFLKASALDPMHKRARYMCAEMYGAIPDLDNTCRILDSLIITFPDYSAPYAYRMRLYCEKGEFSMAKMLLEQHKNNRLTSPANYILESLYYELNDDLENACRTYSQSIHAVSGWKNAARSLLGFYVKSDQYKKAVTLLHDHGLDTRYDLEYFCTLMEKRLSLCTNPSGAADVLLGISAVLPPSVELISDSIIKALIDSGRLNESLQYCMYEHSPFIAQSHKLELHINYCLAKGYLIKAWNSIPHIKDLQKQKMLKIHTFRTFFSMVIDHGSSLLLIFFLAAYVYRVARRKMHPFKLLVEKAQVYKPSFTHNFSSDSPIIFGFFAAVFFAFILNPIYNIILAMLLSDFNSHVQSMQIQRSVSSMPGAVLVLLLVLIAPLTETILMSELLAGLHTKVRKLKPLIFFLSIGWGLAHVPGFSYIMIPWHFTLFYFMYDILMTFSRHGYLKGLAATFYFHAMFNLFCLTGARLFVH